MQPSNELTTRCIGRYLIDLPKDLILTPGSGQRIDDVRLTVIPATAAEYKKALAARTMALDAAMTSRKGVTYPVLRKTVPLPAGIEGVLFDAAKPENVSGRMARNIEVLAWRDGYLIKAEVDAIDTTFPEEKDNDTLQETVKTNVSERTALILDVVSRTSGRTDREIPTRQGVCIVNGFVRGAPTSGELIGAIYQFAQVDNFYMRIASTSLSRGKNTILDRIETTRPMIERAKGRVFRKAKRDVAGMNGYEVAYSLLTDENAQRGRVMTDQFIFELNSAEGSKHRPRLSVEIHNGETLAENSEKNDGSVEPEEPMPPLKPAPLSAAAAESMWDKIIPTIRVRPGSF